MIKKNLFNKYVTETILFEKKYLLHTFGKITYK